MLSAESVLRQITHCGRSMLLILIEVKSYLIYSSEYNHLFFPDAIKNKGTILQNNNVEQSIDYYLYLSLKYDVYIKH